MKFETIFNRESGEYKIATTFKSWVRSINPESVLTAIEKTELWLKPELFVFSAPRAKARVNY